MNEPTQIRAGDTKTWTESGGDYKASDGWTLKYALRSSVGSIDITSTASGDDHLVALTAAVTTNYTAGIYQYQAYVENADSSARHTLYTGSIEILANLVTAGAIDTRSHIRKVFEAIKALLEGRSSKEYDSYQIAGRNITLLKPEELIKWYHHYETLLKQEEAAERVGRGEDFGGQIAVRFDPIS